MNSLGTYLRLLLTDRKIKKLEKRLAKIDRKYTGSDLRWAMRTLLYEQICSFEKFRKQVQKAM